MSFTYFVLLISTCSLQMQKPQMVEVSPVEEVQVVKPKPKKVETVVENNQEEQEWLEENQLDETNLEDNNIDENNNEENIEDYDPELYEEITFQDDFDKEYRNDVWDSYFEDLKENLPSGDSENIEDISE